MIEQKAKNSRQQMEVEQQEQMTLLQQFKQQMLKAWQPVPSLTKTIILFFILSIIFLGLGIPMIILSSSLKQYSIRYDNTCQITTPNATCTLPFQILTEMVGPVFVYYQLHNYYQNHRLYAKSISNSQLKGKAITASQAQTDCQPIVYNSDLYRTIAIDGKTPLNPNAIANPCGIIAYTIFNDSFVLKSNTGGQVSISGQGIAWPSDISRFKITNQAEMWYNVTDQRFMNWVRIASTPNFRKLWGRIDGNLAKGTYSLEINNQFDVSKFKGQKLFVVSQSNFFGSSNHFLSITYIVVGSLCFVIAILFLVKKLMKKNKVQ